MGAQSGGGSPAANLNALNPFNGLGGGGAPSNPLPGAGKTIAGGLDQAGPLGKVLNASFFGEPGALASVLQGKSPVSGTPVGEVTGANGNTQFSPVGAQPQLGNSLINSVAPDGSLIAPAHVGLNQADVNIGAAGDPSLRNLSTYANTPGESPWLQLQRQNVASQVQGMHDSNALSAAAGVQGASDAAASHGGLTGGGAARLGAASLMGLAGANQGANQAGFQTNNNNAVTDMQTKLATQGQVANLKNQTAGVINAGNEWNAGAANNVGAVNAGNDLGAINATDQNTLQKYGQDMSKYIGDNLAQSLQSSGKKKG